jgi:hypothetical protein
MCIVGNPMIYDNLRLVAHMVNDGLNFDFSSKLTEELYELYSYNNCKFVLDNNLGCVSLISTRQIERDEELFVSYGFDYWDL